MRIPGLQQSSCEGSPYDGAEEALSVTGASGSLHVVYAPAHFRCSQAVAGFVLTSGGDSEILVQPIDMNPQTVAKCDCLYTIDMDIEAPEGEHLVSLFRRWDHKSGADDPLQIGSQSVTVPP